MRISKGQKKEADKGKTESDREETGEEEEEDRGRRIVSTLWARRFSAR